ncbi:protein-L-isoaspartate O-methyltransferase-like [Diaphorina citri]|uniref:protein-L-isoaspartate(D-aspartate) O-methyltransferase n=1 Tax=Diaphorina citri TaxID=121845 RepID=A0A1S3D0H6_DIACI|nr:protein-L-isoaspartate O-methyltransferase-like [Diaphorina citri]KAI5710293.1 hypothetical protein M8J75_007415 [Diaphorina citri]KAI5744964.1 hypothetical protein M8J76_007012 [Diaphorina citri]KAI5750762.1 hypothetical protein M8J77_001073 [Diaphorina citri]
MFGLFALIVLHLVYGINSTTSDDVARIIERDKRIVFSKLKDKYLLEDPRIEPVLRKYDRADFLPFQKTFATYKDKYIYLGVGAEFSSPFAHAEALHLLRNHLKPGANVLELGSGTGYLATCMGELVQSNGSVIGLELISPLSDFSVKTAIKHAPHLIEKNILKFFVADGRYGYKQHAPYDVIYTDCSIRSIPSVLLDQLKPGGRFVMTLGRTELPQYLIAVDKDMNGRCTFARVRMRNKVPRLCSNIKEQDLYYQRMYPLKHKQPIPTRANGDYIYGTKQSSSYYILPELSIMGKALDSEEMEHFAAAEKRYQEKIDQIDANYNMDDLLMELRKTTPSTSTKFGQPTSTSTPLLMEYEIWSAA